MPAWACKLDMKKFPLVKYPYVESFELLRHLEYSENKIIDKKKFKNDKVTMPCFFLVKIIDLKNSGTLSLVFYNQDNRRISRRVFEYGKPGGYYDSIRLWGKITELKTGRYRYYIFYNTEIIYEGALELPAAPSAVKKQ